MGYLVCLWLWAVDNAPGGNLSVIDAEDIAEISGWNGDAEAFVNALMDAGFLDVDRTLHDWSDFCGRLIEQREQARERARKNRARYANATLYTTPHETTGKHTTEEETTQPAASANRPSIEEVIAEAEKLGLSEKDARDFYRENEESGWRDNKGYPVRDWRAWVRSWAKLNGRHAQMGPDYSDSLPY